MYNTKNLLLYLILLISIKSYSQTASSIKIENDSLEYEVTVMDVDFNTWLISNARPRGFYSLSYLESNNKWYILDWNNRYTRINNNTSMYQTYIEYNPSIKYGYEVNYILFNYFQYFMSKSGEKLGVRRRLF